MSTEDQAGRAEQGAPMTPQGAARRRLAKAGLGAAGVLWTTRSHASLDFKCVSASAAYSSRLNSNKDDELLACIGRSPGFWRKGKDWPVSTDTLFGEVYGYPGNWDSRISMAPMLTLLNGTDFDPQNLAKHMSAAYLNVKSKKVGYLSELTLKQMWHQLKSSGHYEPARNVFWDVERTKAYLEGTYTAD